MQPDHVTVVACVGNQQHQPRSSQVTLLRRSPPFEHLKVREPRLRFHEGVPIGPAQDRVAASTVACDGDRDLDPPPQRAADPGAEAAEQREVRSIANRIAVRIEVRSELEAERCSHASHEIDCLSGRITALDPSDALRTNTDSAADAPAADAGGDPGRQELLGDPLAQVAAAALANRGGRQPVRHGGSMAQGASLALIAVDPRIDQTTTRPFDRSRRAPLHLARDAV